MSSEFAQELAEKCVKWKDECRYAVIVSRSDGDRIFLVDTENVCCPSGCDVDFIREFLAELIEAGYKAGVDACVVTLSEAAREKEKAVNIATTALQGELREALGVDHGWEECLATVRELVARDKAAPAPIPFDVLVPASSDNAAVDMLAEQAIKHFSTPAAVLFKKHGGETEIYCNCTRLDVARDWLKPWLIAAWDRGVSYGKAGNGAPVPSEEALEAAREEGRKDAYLSAIEDQGDHSFVMTQENAATTEKTSEELREHLSKVVRHSVVTTLRVGYRLAAKKVDEVFKETVEKVKTHEREEEHFRKYISHATENKRQAMAHAEALRQALAKVEEAAPKAEELQNSSVQAVPAHVRVEDPAQEQAPPREGEGPARGLPQAPAQAGKAACSGGD